MYLFFLSGELCHPQLVLVLQFLRRLKLLQETQVVETLAVEELCLHHSHLLLAAVQSQVGETLAELAPCYIPHVVSGRVCVRECAELPLMVNYYGISVFSFIPGREIHSQ